MPADFSVIVVDRVDLSDEKLRRRLSVSGTMGERHLLGGGTTSGNGGGGTRGDYYPLLTFCFIASTLTLPQVSHGIAVA